MTQRQKNILLTLLIVAPFVLTFAFVRLFVDLESLERVNKGTMILPHVQLDALAPRLTNGEAFTTINTRGHWSMLYIADGSCETSCKNALYYLIRQLRLSLGADSNRIERVIMHTAEPDSSLREFLDNNVAGMTELQVRADAVNSAFSAVFTETDSATGKVYVMSPDGQIILWYPSHEQQEQVLLEADNILSDLKRILKGDVNG